MKMVNEDTFTRAIRLLQHLADDCNGEALARSLELAFDLGPKDVKDVVDFWANHALNPLDIDSTDLVNPLMAAQVLTVMEQRAGTEKALCESKLLTLGFAPYTVYVETSSKYDETVTTVK